MEMGCKSGIRSTSARLPLRRPRHRSMINLLSLSTRLCHLARLRRWMNRFLLYRPALSLQLFLRRASLPCKIPSLLLLELLRSLRCKWLLPQ